MEPPNIKGYTILARIGEGSSGTVFEARRDDGKQCAIKVFDSMSSNPALIGSRVSRVIDGGASDITVPVIARALDARPACLVMPFLAEKLGGDGGYRPKNLQIHFEKHLANDNTWPFILKLASRLARLHSTQVAHGNLKPGHIFLGDNGGPLLTDYAGGRMPDVHRLAYSDALLYAPPEQLRHPEGYLEEAGYRWDVYAFGVLSYRLLTGVFPRCEEVFSPVTPPAGSEQRFRIDADYEGIACSLEQFPEFSWPSEPANQWEALHREMLNFCLALDPLGRPADMCEVTRYFNSIESDLASAAENSRMEDLRLKTEKRRRRASRFGLLATLVAGGLGAGWALTEVRRTTEATAAREEFDAYRLKSGEEIANLESSRDQALAAEKTALASLSETQTLLSGEQDRARDEILSARMTNEALFQWILERGVSGLPPLEGRRTRLGFLAEKLDEQLEGMEARPGLEEQVALLRFRKAEVLLAAGDSVKGAEALKNAIASGGLDENNVAHAMLRLLLLQSKRDKASLEAGLASFEAAILKAWPADEARRIRAKAALDLVKARMWEYKNEGEQALGSYLESLKGFKKLADLYPESAAIALTVGRTYLSSALAAEGEGAVSDAARLRQDAVDAFTELAKKQEHPEPELEYQIASAMAAKAVALWQQGKTFEADQMARKGVAELGVLAQKMPDDFRVTIDLVSQQGIIATAMRDEGKAEEAVTMLRSGIRALEDGLEQEPKNWNARYLLASLKWQLAGVLGQQGEGEAELTLGAEAHDELKALLASGMKNPNPSAVRKALAYLCGDLGHSADLRKKRDLAVQYLQESKRYWQELVRDEGDQIEFREGYYWAVERLAEMGVE